MHRRHLLALAAAAAARPALAQTGAQTALADLVAAARKEGKLSIYGTTDATEAGPMLEAFRKEYPFIALEYADQNSTELYNKFVAEAAANSGTADLLWSSAMDLQIKLVNDGYAQSYQTTERKALPDWAVWKDQAFGITAEPIAIVYNTRLVPEADVPRSHADLLRLVTEQKAKYQGKVTSYDIERSGVGFLFITQDAQQDADGTMKLARALGAAGAKFYTSSGAMMERILSGEHLVGFNMIGSYAMSRRAKDPAMGVVLPKDWALVMSRVAFIPKGARNPACAKLMLDFMLSKPGQAALATSNMGPVRTDMDGGDGGGMLAGYDRTKLRPIPINQDLLGYLDQTKRLRFLRDWGRALQGK